MDNTKINGDKISFGLSAPWIIYANELKSFFAYDKDVDVSELGSLVKSEDDGMFYGSIIICVKGHKKYEALLKLLPPSKNFGVVRIVISVVEYAESAEYTSKDLLIDAFKENLLLQDIVTSKLPGLDIDQYFVVLRPEVLQFYTDDLRSYKGLSTFVAEDVARDIFCSDELDGSRNVCFSTADIREND